MKLVKALCRHLLHWVLTLLLIFVMVFVLLRQMPEEGYFNNYDKCSEAQIQARLHQLGLDKPLLIQMKDYLGNLLKGDFGVSTRYQQNQPIARIIRKKAPVSAAVGLSSLFLAVLLGIPAGMLMAWSAGTRRKLLDRCLGLIFVGIQAVPAAAYCLIIQLYGSKAFGISMLFDGERPVTWILPVVSLSLGNLSLYSVWLRRYILEEKEKDYVLTVQAKGIPETRVELFHVFRNAVIPLAQFLPSSIVVTLMGSIYVESLFSIPGMGGLLVQAIKIQDNMVVQALVLIYSSLSIAAVLAGDILMAFLNRRGSYL